MNEQKAIEKLEKTKELWEKRLVWNANDSAAINEVEILDTAIAALEGIRWIPVAERLPVNAEFAASTADGEYFRRLEIAVQTDTIVYYIGYFDGYKWFDKRHRGFKGDVVAWKVHQPYKQEQPSETGWKDHMMERFGRVN